jgi:hypothetical protein
MISLLASTTTGSFVFFVKKPGKGRELGGQWRCLNRKF